MELSDSDEPKLVEAPEEHEQTLMLTEPVNEEFTAVRPHDTEDGQSLLQTIIMIVGAIILIILIVLFARWIYHKAHNSSTPPVTTTNQPQNQGSPSPQPGANQQPSTPSSPSQNNTPSQNGKPLTNTGPGNVIAIFAGSTLAAAGLHYIVSLRRSVNSRE